MSETSIYVYETTHRNIPESCYLYINRRDNVKSHMNVITFIRTWAIMNLWYHQIIHCLQPMP
jgi:hypothetical protein